MQKFLHQVGYALESENELFFYAEWAKTLGLLAEKHVLLDREY